MKKNTILGIIVGAVGTVATAAATTFLVKGKTAEAEDSYEDDYEEEEEEESEEDEPESEEE